MLLNSDFTDDPRFKDLRKNCGNKFLAMGACLRAWLLEHKLRTDARRIGLIPRTAWDAEGGLDPLIDCGLAAIEGECVRVDLTYVGE